MTAPRRLQFETEQQVIDEVARLRQGYVRAGNWTLPQICWHIGFPIKAHLNPPDPIDLAPTPEQAAIKAGFVDFIIQHRKAPPGIENAPPTMIPPVDLAESEIDDCVAGFRKLQQYPHPKVLMGPIGPVTADEFRLVNVFHSAHHLSFLTPKYTRRSDLKYASTDAVRADITKLREAYAFTGTWTLPQTCRHLEMSMLAAMKPGPYPADTDEQKARRPVFERVLSDGKLPAGIIAPPQMVPPANTPEQAIDSMMSVLDEFDAHSEPFAPHRLFGTISAEDRRRLNLIHCANHLSYLVPTDTSSKH